MRRESVWPNGAQSKNTAYMYTYAREYIRKAVHIFKYIFTCTRAYIMHVHTWILKGTRDYASAYARIWKFVFHFFLLYELCMHRTNDTWMNYETSAQHNAVNLTPILLTLLERNVYFAFIYIIHQVKQNENFANFKVQKIDFFIFSE